MTLNELPLNTIGIIESVHCRNTVRRRMLDLGLINGTKIVPIFKSPSGDPIAYEIRKTLIAIRKEDSQLITLK